MDIFNKCFNLYKKDMANYKVYIIFNIIQSFNYISSIAIYIRS